MDRPRLHSRGCGIALYGDNGIVIDLDEMASAVDVADVIVVGFEFWAERLLIDLRPDPAGTPPIIEVVEPVRGVQERTEWLNDRRPGLPPADQFLFFVWPHSIEYLRRSALAPTVAARVARDQHLDVGPDLAAAFSDLERREWNEFFQIVRGGEGYETAWSHADRP